MNNAIVVMFDSLQFNYLGCYGNTWIKTPNFDRFAREGVLFENCYIEGLPTVPCRRAMHTGRYTLPKAGWVALNREDTTIADLCWGRPIDTALVLDCPMYRLPKFGYTRGFDKVWFTHGHEADQGFYSQDPLIHFKVEDFIEDHISEQADTILGEKVMFIQEEEINSYLKQCQYWKSDEDRYVARTMKKAVEYLEQVDRNKQFFLWVDSFDPHEPWNPPSVYLGYPCPYDPDYKGKDQFLPLMAPVEGLYTEEEMHHILMLYAELVTLCDKWLGYFLDNVRRLGFEENTLVMVVSDHGEPMGNGEHGHGIMRKIRPWPYEELAHAPMFLRAPGIAPGQRIKAFVQSVDVAPTVCDWLGIGVHPDMQGKSLLPLVRGEVEKVHDFAIAGFYKYSWSIITEEWSYIHWLHKGDTTLSESRYGMYGKGTSEAAGTVAVADPVLSKPKISKELENYLNGTTMDGEAQWTCTPGSVAEVPAIDELYNRAEDPFQLHNVISEHPDIAKKLLSTLKTYMQDLQA